MFQISKLVTLCSLTLCITACQTTQVERESTIAIPTVYSESMTAKGSADISQWWAQWHDPLLNTLIEQGLQNSHDIQIAESNLNQALAISRLASADLGPTIGAAASVDKFNTSSELSLDSDVKDILGGAASLIEQKFDVDGGTGKVGFSAAWEPDIFGKKRSDSDAAYYAAMGMQEKVYGAQMLVANQIAEHYLQARAIEKREAIANRNIDVLRRYQQYINRRFDAGHVTKNEVNNINSKLNAALAQKSTLEAEYAAHARSIAVLTGQVPQNFVLPKATTDIFAQLPDAPAGQTPQGLLERRPDIRAYANQVQAYSAKLASAEADLLPRFSINFLGMGGRLELDSDIPDLKGWGHLLSVGVQVPLFTNGRIKANIEGADAKLQTALLQYDQSILRALSEVDSAYQVHHALLQQHDLLNSAYTHANKRASDAQKLFRYGEHTLNDALDAQLEAQQMQELLVKSDLARATMLLNLYKALGGGWTANSNK